MKKAWIIACTDGTLLKSAEWHSVIWCDVSDPMYMDRYGLKEV